MAPTDCVGGVVGQVCWPTAVSITTANTPFIGDCDCVSEGCGKIAVQTFADGTFAYRCLDTCPDPTQPCVIYKNGNATANSAIHSSQIAVGDNITCGCKPPPPMVCPLETGTKICESVQAVDCQATAAGDICRPDVVQIGPNGQVLGKRCDCFPTNPTCGPVLVFQNAGQPTQISCDVNCPNPAVEQCHIYRNGFSTGLISAPATAFSPGDELSCACDPILDPVCPLPPTPWCANLQNINCRDGQPGEECTPTLVTIGFTGDLDICACDCQAGGCQEVTIIPDPTGYTLACPNACPIAGQDCVIHVNNVPTTVHQIHSTQVLGQYISCDCAGQNQCPQAPGNWCQNLQSDCLDGAAGEVCWPTSASITAANTPAITACDCLGQGCGKMTVTTFADGTFAYRCLDQCPDPTQPCVIYKNGNATANSAIHSSQIAAGDTITCDCKPPPPAVCPLQTGTKICESVQAVDCQATTPGETCKPDVVIIGPNGQVLGRRCTCYPDDATCGPVLVIDLPPSQGGTQISCDVFCPDPTVEQCNIYVNGSSIGVISAPASAFNPGDELTCGCDPIHEPVCPLESGVSWCAGLQDLMCRDGQADELCEPTQVVVSFQNTIDVCGCDCLASECQAVTVTPDPAGYTLSCDNGCPIAGQQCVIHINGAQTTMTSIHSTQVLGQYVSCDCAGVPSCPRPDGPFGAWCAGLESTDCLGGQDKEECWPAVVTVTATGQPVVDSCDCMEHCGPVTIALVGGTYQFHCEHLCETPGLECVIHRNGFDTGLHQINASDVAPGDQITCDCPTTPQPCPLEPNTSICKKLQAQDCQNPVAGEVCRPEVVVVGFNGAVVAKRCDCHPTTAMCGGPVFVIDTPNGKFISCDFNCPNPATEQCVIFWNGASTGMISAPASMFPPPAELYCDCDPFTPPCPLDPGTSWCANLQPTDCRDGLPGEQCEATKVAVTTAGINVRECDCLRNDCQAMSIIPDPIGYTMRCDNVCPTPPGGQCVIHLDGAATTLTSIHSTQAVGHDVTCDCAQVQLGACCYVDAAGVPACTSPISGADCAALGGSFIPGGNCTGTTEACCMPDGTCQNIDPTCCLAAGGSSQGAGSSCSGTIVACCDPLTGACKNTDATCCANPSFGTLCTGATVACCFATGTCADLDVPCCLAAGGSPQAAGTNCSMVPSVCGGPLCPLPTNAPPWCDQRRPIDCQNGGPNENCKPKVVSTTTAGGLDVQQCDCQTNVCGDVTITQVASGYVFRCVNPCDEPNEKCLIHRDGTATSVSSVHSSTVAPGEKITCDCVKDDVTFCPLDPQLDICLGPLQQRDCQGTATELCKAKIVVFDANHNPVPKQCDCFSQDGKCGPVLLFPAPPPLGGWTVSCDQACPVGEQCVIHRNGNPTTMVTANSSIFGPNEEISCDCNPPQECKPTADGQACTPCPDPTLQCVPTLIQWNPGTVPNYRILDCDCTQKCHINPPPTPTAPPQCSGGCPGSPLTLPKKCIKKKDPVTGAWSCRCVPIIPDLDPADPTLRKNRYLSMSPSGALGRGIDEGPIGAIRLTLDDLMNPQPPNIPGQNPPNFSAFEGEYRWAGMIGEYPEDSFGETFFAAGMSCDAMFQDYSVIDEFSIFGAEVMPSSAYTIQTVGEECSDSLDEEECYSDGTPMATGRYGDVTAAFQNPFPPLTQPNAPDIGKIVDVVKQVPGAPHKTTVQLAPNVINPERAANAIDIGEGVDAVKGRAYHLFGPCPCPSAVVCSPATLCTGHGDCTMPAICVNGYCSTARDACGRCTAP